MPGRRAPPALQTGEAPPHELAHSPSPRPRLPHLLFVLAAEMRTALLKLDAARQRGDLCSLDPQIEAVGDVNFLGPFDANQRLESLNGQNPQRLDKQLAQLVDRLLATGGLRIEAAMPASVIQNNKARDVRSTQTATACPSR
jgi:hypothetical protein